MKKIATALLLYAAFLIASLPAAFLDRMLDHYSDGILRLSNTEGTFWHGSGTLGVSGKFSGYYAWRISFPELILGKLHMRLDSGMELIMKPAHLEIRHASLDLPASVLSLLGKQMSALRPGGMLHIKANDFILSRKSSGEFMAKWENATSPLSRVNPFGSYNLTVRGQGGRLDLDLDTAEGPLTLSGKGAWSKQGGLQFSGIGQSADPGVAQLLRLAGPPLGGGRYALRLF